VYTTVLYNNTVALLPSFPLSQAVKKGQGPEGSVRCTFEDKILMSDIVFPGAWSDGVRPQTLQPGAPAPAGPGATWQGMRTVGQLRREQQLPIPVNTNSLYKVTSLYPAEVSLYVCQAMHVGGASKTDSVQYITVLNPTVSGSYVQKRTVLSAP